MISIVSMLSAVTLLMSPFGIGHILQYLCKFEELMCAFSHISFLDYQCQKNIKKLCCLSQRNKKKKKQEPRGLQRIDTGAKADVRPYCCKAGPFAR